MIGRVVMIGTLVVAFGFTGFAGAADLFKATLTGSDEVPSLETDTRGRLEILVNRGATVGEYTLRVHEGIRLTQAHLHCGPSGVNGPVIVFLAGFHQSGWDVDGKWISKATITDENVVNPTCGATLAEIFGAAHEGNVYVNVHSVEHPAGVVRGQLEPVRR